MTTDQAIKILEGAIKKPNTKDGYLGQALTMAIEALKNQPEIIRCKDCEWWDKKEDSALGYCRAIRHGCHSRHWEINIIRKYPEDFFCGHAELRGTE